MRRIFAPARLITITKISHIPDPVNPNVKKYIVPHGTHTDNFEQYGWYDGGKEVAKQILDDVIALLNQ